MSIDGDMNENMVIHEAGRVSFYRACDLKLLGPYITTCHSAFVAHPCRVDLERFARHVALKQQMGGQYVLVRFEFDWNVFAAFLDASDDVDPLSSFLVSTTHPLVLDGAFLVHPVAFMQAGLLLQRDAGRYLLRVHTVGDEQNWPEELRGVDLDVFILAMHRVHCESSDSVLCHRHVNSRIWANVQSDGRIRLSDHAFSMIDVSAYRRLCAECCAPVRVETVFEVYVRHWHSDLAPFRVVDVLADVVSGGFWGRVP